jgi:hypothetical protein
MNDEEIRRIAREESRRRAQRMERERASQQRQQPQNQELERGANQEQTQNPAMQEIARRRQAEYERHRQEQEDRERREREERERREQEDRERREREEALRREREEAQRQEREERQRREREEMERQEQEQKNAMKERFIRELNRRLNKNIVEINLPEFYNTDLIMEPYVEFGLQDEGNFSFYVGDVYKIFKNLELLYASPRNRDNFDFIDFLITNGIFWNYMNLKEKILNESILATINRLYFRIGINANPFYFSIIIQYYLQYLFMNEQMGGDIDTTELENILEKHINLYNALSEDQQNSYEINNYIAENLLNGKNEDEILDELIGRFFTQQGGRHQYKQKYMKYINKIKKL